MFQGGVSRRVGRLRPQGSRGWPDRRQLLNRIGGLGAIAFGVSGCDARHKISANVKLTFTMRFGDKLIHQAGIWQMNYVKVSAFPNPGFSYYWVPSGDAICIYASRTVKIFAIMMYARGDIVPATIPHLEDWDCGEALEAGYGVSLDWVGEDCPGLRALITSAPTKPVPVPVSSFPTLIAFTDSARAETGAAIDPRDDFSRFGAADARVERLEIQLVNEPVERDAVAQLPWLRSSRRDVAGDPPWTDFARHPEYFSR